VSLRAALLRGCASAVTLALRTPSPGPAGLLGGHELGRVAADVQR